MALLNESHNISGEYNNYKCLGVGTKNPNKNIMVFVILF